MTLLQKAVSLTGRIKEFHENRARGNEQKAVLIKLDEWNQARSLLAESLERLYWFDEPLSEELKKLLRSCHKVTGGVRELLDTRRSGYALEEKQSSWIKALSTVTKCSDAIVADTRGRWKRYINSIGLPEAPQDVEKRMPGTDENRRLLSEYRLTYANYQKIRGLDQPQRREDLVAIRGLVDRLRVALTDFTFNLPDEVLRFLNASTREGAALEMYTDTVKAWIQGEKRSKSFVIKYVNKP